jgi:hypothetical protein
MITDEPETLLVLETSKLDLVKEYKKILWGMMDQYFSAKDMHELYFDPQSKKYERGLKTIYRYIEKLQEEGLIKEAGQRMTEGSRAVETLYCRTAKIFFYEGPEVLDQWKTPENREFLDKIRIILQEYHRIELEPDEFTQFAMDFFTRQDTISSELIRIAQEKSEILNNLKDLAPEKISKLVFTATNLAILRDLSNETSK